ncbi:MAG: 50S ribosomal protein L25 [marine bacterium B5-7]|nr:MAG: 50S ribosomal protein L25 [marine bacterium B5-7]
MSAAIFELNATTRQTLGTGHSRRLRHAGQVPAVIYGAHEEPVSLTLEHSKVIRALENEAFYSHILTIDVDGKAEKAVLKDVQRHPFKPKIQHMDFMRVSAKETLQMRVPIHFNGEEKNLAVKEGGVVSHLLNEIEISCLPSDLPEFLPIDVSTLGVDQSLHLSDLKMPKGVELATPVDEEHNQALVSISAQRAAEEEPTAAPEAPAEEKPAGDKDKAGE